jgi:hypothetical protein
MILLEITVTQGPNGSLHAMISMAGSINSAVGGSANNGLSSAVIFMAKMLI